MDGTEKGMTMRLDDEEIIVKPRVPTQLGKSEPLDFITFDELADHELEMLIANFGVKQSDDQRK